MRERKKLRANYLTNFSMDSTEILHAFEIVCPMELILVLSRPISIQERQPNSDYFVLTLFCIWTFAARFLLKLTRLYDTSLNDLDFNSSLQWYDKAETSVLISSHFFKSIWMEFGVLPWAVGLFQPMLLILEGGRGEGWTWFTFK